MSMVFNAEEILEMAAQIERNGASYYRRAALLVESKEGKAMLEDLAVMEDGHEIVFENMRGNPDLLSRLLGDVDGPAVLYLRALAGGHVFKKGKNPADRLQPGVTLREILEEAISMELTSIAFYEGIRQGMTAELGRDKLEDIIHEEMSHVTLLSKRLETLAE